MRIGVPKEIKVHEYRVGAQPAGVRQLVSAGHEVLVEAGAGLGSGFADAAYVDAGASIVPTAEDAWSADLVVKVKEPIAPEYGRFRPGLVLYTYLHLAAEPELTRQLIDRGVRALAYETVTDALGGLPLLRPMSEIAGRMAAQVGSYCLEREHGGKGLLLSGVPGTRKGRVTIIGGGVVGTAAARMAIGYGAEVTILDVSAERMAYLEDVFGSAIETLYSNPDTIAETVPRADLLVGAVLVPGGAAPRLVDRNLIRQMEPGSVVVDVAVDQGGCIETCRPTTHDDPTFVVDDVVHYCVANMPGAVPRTSTYALTNVTIRPALEIASKGIEAAIRSSRHLADGINTWDGACTIAAVAAAHGLEHTPLEKVL
ncbi:MAG: alanine dehydrogenase [Myxococcota bacterium]|nr:alanine dehydrogenase [Myxococcota bacterium]